MQSAAPETSGSQISQPAASKLIAVRQQDDVVVTDGIVSPHPHHVIDEAADA